MVGCRSLVTLVLLKDSLLSVRDQSEMSFRFTIAMIFRAGFESGDLNQAKKRVPVLTENDRPMRS